MITLCCLASSKGMMMEVIMPWVTPYILNEYAKVEILCLHICLDPPDHIKAMIREPYCYWNVEDTIQKLEVPTVFTFFDMKKGYKWCPCPWIMYDNYIPALPLPMEASITPDFHLALLFLVMFQRKLSDIYHDLLKFLAQHMSSWYMVKANGIWWMFPNYSLSCQRYLPMGMIGLVMVWSQIHGSIPWKYPKTGKTSKLAWQISWNPFIS